MNNRNLHQHSSPQIISARQALENSRLALQQGDRRLARRWAEEAIRLDPQREDPWLFLAALASPRASLAYLQKALEINPNSQRAQKGIAWAFDRINAQELQPTFAATYAPTPTGIPKTSGSPSTLSNQPIILLDKHGELSAPSLEDSSSRVEHIRISGKRRRTEIPFAFWYAFGMLFFAVLFLSVALSPFSPQILFDLNQNVEFILEEASKLSNYHIGNGADEIPGEPGQITPTEFAYQPPLTTEAAPSATPYLPASNTPTPFPSPTASATPLPTETSIPSPTPTLEPSPLPSATLKPETAIPQPQPTKKPKKKVAAASGPGLRPQNVTLNDRWIDVDLSSQQVFAMQGSQVMRSFVVSTGRWPTVTVTGTYKIYVKYRTANMSGDDYFLPNVPYVMYFFKGYGLHGTYWHNNFGTPMSHGCVNFRPNDAAWIYDFASVGTIVNIHP